MLESAMPNAHIGGQAQREPPLQAGSHSGGILK